MNIHILQLIVGLRKGVSCLINMHVIFVIFIISMNNYYSRDNANHPIFYLSNYFVAHVSYQRKDKPIKIFFLCCIMRNLQKNLNIATTYFQTTPPFRITLPPHPFSRKNFQTPSISTNFEKAELPQLYEEEGAGSNYASLQLYHKRDSGTGVFL